MLFIITASILSVFSGCTDKNTQNNLTHVPCGPRGTTEPGRLNIEANAKEFGTASPCEFSMNFYIAENSALRSVSGVVSILDNKSTNVKEIPISIQLTDTDFGMFAKEINPGSVEGYSCRRLSLLIQSFECSDGDGDKIKCPDIRLKSSLVFNGLDVSGEGLNICYDE